MREVTQDTLEPKVNLDQVVNRDPRVPQALQEMMAKMDTVDHLDPQDQWDKME